MAQFHLDAAKIEESLGPLERVANGNVVELVDSLAQALLPQAGSNELVDEVIANCKKVQENYNSGFLPGLQATITEYKKVVDISEYLAKKASVGSVANEDTGFATGKINTDAVVI